MTCLPQAGANLVFSCIVRSDGNIGDILLRSSDRYEFFAHTLLVDELEKHRTKLRKMARMGCTLAYGGSSSAISMAVMPSDQMSALQS